MAEQRGSGPAYALGIDLGTTYSAAAVLRGSTVEVCVLGTIAAQIPSIVVHRENAEVLTGEAAERRAGTEPTRTAREFKRRLGDPIPIIVGGTPYGAEALMAEMLEAIVDQVAEREGRRPRLVVLSHPANYTEYKRGLLLEAARLAGLDLDQVRLIPEPEAAAIAYAKQERIDAGEVIAVYDFGGGTFDAAVVRKTAAGFELLGTPEGMERLGGIDFDQAVIAHVDDVLAGLVSAADGSDPQVLAGQIRLRDECRRAKEALSNDTDTTIPVSIPGVQTDVRLTRDEFEQMVRPRVVETVKALVRTIASTGLAVDDVSRVLLVGGSSRMPIVAEVVRESIGRPISVDADPKMAIAIGAAYSALIDAVEPTGDLPAARPVPAPATIGRRPPRRTGVIAAGVVGIAASAGVIAYVARPGGGSVTSEPTSPTASVAAVDDVSAGVDPVDTRAEPANESAVDSVADSTGDPTGEATGADATSGIPERFAFTGVVGTAGIPGPALDAEAPGALTGLAIAPNGVTYVITSSPVVLAVRDGEATIAAELPDASDGCTGITVGSDGAVFVATGAGIVRIADGGSALVLDGRSAGLSGTLGPLALDGGGNLYIADNGTARIIRRAPDGALTLVAGTGTPADSGSTPVEGGAAATSSIGMVTGLVVDRQGRLLIADAGLRMVRAVAPDGTISTIAGGGAVDIDTALAEPQGVAPREIAFGSIDALALDDDQNAYVSVSASAAVVRFGPNIGLERVAGDLAASLPTVGLGFASSGELIYSDGLALWSMRGIAESG